MESHGPRYGEAENTDLTEGDTDPMANKARSFRIEDDDWEAVGVQAERDHVRPAQAIILLARGYGAGLIPLPEVREEIVVNYPPAEPDGNNAS